MISRWAPPAEKGKFVAALMGNTLGTVITWPLLGAVIRSIGWVWAFIIPAVITTIWAVIWFFTVSDSPSDHWWITDEERDYITSSFGESVKKVKVRY